MNIEGQFNLLAIYGIKLLPQCTLEADRPLENNRGFRRLNCLCNNERRGMQEEKEKTLPDYVRYL